MSRLVLRSTLCPSEAWLSGSVSPERGLRRDCAAEVRPARPVPSWTVAESGTVAQDGVGTMSAIVIQANIEDRAEAKRGRDEEVIPMMKGAPGFVGT